MQAESALQTIIIGVIVPYNSSGGWGGGGGGGGGGVGGGGGCYSTKIHAAYLL